ncbi:non-homologous end-joining DNA ligase LigD [Cellulomonas sp. Leaf395]|uniref:non-homologous end-joining DNA ligase LigD n=1 Tax=Cellulomonas sp. Leaf395 TaxID=1736362 RepID=UPI0007010488|nr:DNA polymerase ligase N-terminal domain-containing protein [Cellulomonas sp. Leaf395]KQS97640.1 ATP-dependent DNA ligase [Cellulomonas sp. Leaf395]
MQTERPASTSPELETYRSMRDFGRTPEPSGAPSDPQAAPKQRRFVVQRHRARRLHYDFRLEMDGVLVSWAVPRGPTLDPTVRRMAVHVEDHPLEYADFEGVIPSGQYGGGDVIVWDRGTWEPYKGDDPVSDVAAGELHAELHGSRLRGRFVLVRRGEADRNGKEQWLLLHKRDEHAVDGWDAEDHPTSVVSGRTNDEVKAAPDRLWRSDLPAAQASVELTTTAGPTQDELDALDDLGGAGPWEVFGRRLRLTNLDKVLFPARAGEEPVTKRELVRYAARIAPIALPYLRGRPLNMHRYPQGASHPGFWHKQVPDHAPDWLARWHNPDADPGETTTYLMVDEAAALVWAANFGALEWHAWTSTSAVPHRPTYALVDIDPGTDTPWDDVLLMARLHRDAFAHLGVRAYPKLTGRPGIQVWVPIRPGPGFDETRAWVERLSRTVGKVIPDLVSWRWEVRERGGLARLDYTQNAINKTLVAPYSPRAAAGAPVSAPITWDELDAPWLRPAAFTVRTVLDRIAERGDPFRGVLAADQVLPRLA